MKSDIEEKADGKSKIGKIVREIINFALIAILVVLPFRIYVAQPFLVSGESMVPTFKNGEYLIIDQLSYRFMSPKRDSVLIFRYPNDPSKFFIKRIIGLPGETVEIRGLDVYITNKENPGGFKLNESFIERKMPGNLKITLKDSEYFVLGDNRLQSSDSRYWGPLPEKNIIGRPILRLFPLNTISVFPGDKSVR